MLISPKHRKGERGQILILCAVCLIIMLLFVGLAIDFGLAYVTKASLGKAVDAAVLTAAKNTGLGQAQYTPIAQSAFNLNYGTSGRDTQPPSFVICNNGPCPIDSLGNTLLTITATSTIKTYFLGLLPAFSTLNVSSTAEARFARLEMTVVLDRSGSMQTNAPPPALSNAVTQFIDQFDDTNDSVALISFAADVTENFAMQTGTFQTAIITDTKTIQKNFNGATWSDGALQMAKTEEAKVLALPGNPHIVHVVLFFTDGNANTIQDAATCTGGTAGSGTWSMGGFDPPDTSVAFITKGTNNTVCTETGSDNCCRTGNFPSHLAGKAMPINTTNVYADGDFRAIADANAMRATVPPTIVYAIGLQGPGGSVNKGLLCQIANDPSTISMDALPACSAYFTANPNTPQGVVAMASSPAELITAFQSIAADIRLRLLQ
jgi:Flp pilus assembly protein TadG